MVNNFLKEDTADGRHVFSHNLIFTLFSSVAIQREQRKNQEQENREKGENQKIEKRAKIRLWQKHEVRLLCLGIIGILSQRRLLNSPKVKN